ncbi:MAG: phosphonate ABC transporter ATP-binding protein [Stappia sp.]|uniref:phosphonate ABC transporter ATP-binding protein n=1 Tax=Stappia sp. TaxID=1870903 RepID=UPI000C4BBBF4|nr:phosphonate ABC transporter ATP-binding protein [Stappia sp.]MAA98963.1 phosphonate ABC transporter ATP-binding protein [Stappia sp.]MBM19004.1 phosphonate ABC transporter ATP-binding protein [Stappia sp.]
MSAIEVRSVSKTFERGKPVLRNVSFSVAEGEMVALIGASGSGKSTLLRLLCGLETIDRGASSTLSLLGRDVQRDGRRTGDARRLRRDVGVVFQQFNLVNRLSVLANVLAGRLGKTPAWRGTLGLFTRSDRIRALSALERVGIVDFARRRASRLSGGQQQRAAIARTLTQEARLILADEPIASLDPASADTVMETLSRINREDGVTVVVSLHQIDHAFRHCRRIVALKAGELVYDGPASGIDRATLSDLYDSESLSDTDIPVPAHAGTAHGATPSAPAFPDRIAAATSA